MFDPILLTVLGLFAAFALWESVRPGREFPRVSAWRFKGVLFFFAVLLVAEYPALLWDDWLAEHRLFDATALGHVGGAAVGFVVFQLVLYFVHRFLQHGTDSVWRWAHQFHHSAERVDVFGAFYFSPLDVVSLGLVSSVSLVWAVGVTAPAAIAASVGSIFCTIFQHANIKTPRWLGWFVQRPEMHQVHHERGVHAHNYADLPVIDMLFGTYKNPDRFEGEVGYWDGASKRMVPMLLGRDVAVEPPTEKRKLSRFVTLVALSQLLSTAPGQEVERSKFSSLLPEVIPIHTAPADPVGGEYGTWAAGKNYKASFHDGFAFYAYGPGGLQGSFGWKTECVRFGDVAIQGEVAAGSVRSGTRYEYSWGDVVEAYDVRADGVEQTFVIAKRPELDGDLWIKGRVTSELTCEAAALRHGPLAFCGDDQRTQITYGAAVAIDAEGRRCAMRTSFSDGVVQLALSEEWIRRARFPLIVDPLIRNRVLLGQNRFIESLDCVRDDTEVDDNLWITYALSSGDLVVIRVQEEPAALATQVFVDISNSWRAGDARIAAVGGVEKVVTVFRRVFSSTQRSSIRWHAHAKSDLQLRTAVGALSTPSGRVDRLPAIGGSRAFRVGRHALLAFQRDRVTNPGNSDVLASLIDLSTSSQGTPSSVFPISAASGFDEERPRINPESEGGSAHSWLVAWQERANEADDLDIHVRRVDNRGGVSSGTVSTEDAREATDKIDPVIAGSDGRYLLAYRSRASGRHRLRVQRIDWKHGTALGSRPHPMVTLEDVVSGTHSLGGCAFDTTSASHWGLTYAYRNGPEELVVTKLGFRGRPTVREIVRRDPNGNVLIGHAGAIAFDDDGDRFPLVYATDIPGQHARQIIYNVFSTSFGRSAPFRYGNGCTAARLEWTGSQRIGGEFESLRLRFAPASSPAFLSLSLATGRLDLAPFGMAGCELLVDLGPALVASVPFVTNPSGSFELPVPLTESVKVRRLLAQAFHLAPEANAAGLVSTQGLEVPIGR